MRVAVLGTGQVGRRVADGLATAGHEVALGSRTASEETRTFAEAAAFAEVVVNATGGIVSLEALTAAGADNLAGKPLLDLSNPLDHSGGFPPVVLASQEDSNAERIQAAFPQARVVKWLNTMNNQLMVQPDALPGPSTTFIAGDDEAAKQVARQLLRELGWQDHDILDLGDLTGARALELYLVLWLRLAGALGGSTFNINVVRA
jgi:8-hydroxy-5-deazaflavin:NADPH oxidoreductase